MERKHFSRLLLAILFIVSFSQFPRGVDFEGYYHTLLAARSSGFAEIPYPTGQVEQGAYFQSPVLSVLYTPFTWLSPFGAKLLWAILVSIAFLGLSKKWLSSQRSRASSFFLFLLFTYPCTDVFLSGNTNVLIFMCLMSGLLPFLALALFLKPQVVLLVPFLGRRVGKIASWVLGWFLMTLVFFGPNLSLLWWRRWVEALKYYGHAAGPGRVSFQSPPAMAFRLFGEKLFLANLVGIVFAGSLLFLATRRPRAAFAFLLAALYVVTPFSWASAILFLFPLALEYLNRGEPSIPAWVFVLLYALLQKALLPRSIWEFLIEHNHHGWCLVGLITLFVLRVFEKEPNWLRGTPLLREATVPPTALSAG